MRITEVGHDALGLCFDLLHMGLEGFAQPLERFGVGIATTAAIKGFTFFGIGLFECPRMAMRGS